MFLPCFVVFLSVTLENSFETNDNLPKKITAMLKLIQKATWRFIL